MKLSNVVATAICAVTPALSAGYASPTAIGSTGSDHDWGAFMPVSSMKKVLPK